MYTTFYGPWRRSRIGVADIGQMMDSVLYYTDRENNSCKQPDGQLLFALVDGKTMLKETSSLSPLQYWVKLLNLSLGISMDSRNKTVHMNILT